MSSTDKTRMPALARTVFLFGMSILALIALTGCDAGPDEDNDIRSSAVELSTLVVDGNFEEACSYLVPYQASLPVESLETALRYIFAIRSATEADEWTVDETTNNLRIARLDGHPAVFLVFVSIEGEWLLNIGPDALSIAFRQVDPESWYEDFSGTVSKDVTGNTTRGIRTIHEAPVYYGYMDGEFVYASRIIISANASSIDTNEVYWMVNGERAEATVEWTYHVEGSAGVYEFPDDGNIFTFIEFGVDREVPAGAELELFVGGLTIHEDSGDTTATFHRTFRAEPFRIPASLVEQP